MKLDYTWQIGLAHEQPCCNPFSRDRTYSNRKQTPRAECFAQDVPICHNCWLEKLLQWPKRHQIRRSPSKGSIPELREHCTPKPKIMSTPLGSAWAEPYREQQQPHITRHEWQLLHQRHHCHQWKRHHPH